MDENLKNESKQSLKDKNNSNKNILNKTFNKKENKLLFSLTKNKLKKNNQKNEFSSKVRK